MLVRDANPFGPNLKHSDCVFDWRSESVSPTAAWLECLNALHGTVQYSNSGRMRVAIPHAQVDAFGGLYFIKDLITPTSAFRGETRSERSYGGYQLLSASFACDEKNIPRRATQTLTQRFLGALIHEFAWSHELLAVVVAMDDLTKINDSNFRGNSLSLVQGQAQRFRKVCESDSAAWRTFLRLRAARALESQSLSPEINPHLVLSSLGNIARYSWSPILNGTDFHMHPTPNSPSSANLVVWSYGDRHTISLASTEAHPAYQDFDKIAKLWRGLFHAA